ncbi:hypothetical protein E2C01_094541 [Portunus trituberculatus]|uniref:Uncharacterized protein n=1 Tax=Portunus trituberculatus TaxID=210409 RepID=A0A5B7JX53_PORTR|nr:hypothetical protein [Portunus trituberculatus]
MEDDGELNEEEENGGRGGGRRGKGRKGIQRKEQTTKALLKLTRLSVYLCYHYRFYELEAEEHQGSRKKSKRAQGES